MKRALVVVALLAACNQRSALPPPVLPLTPSPDAPFRAVPPAVEATPLKAPEVRTAVLANGMRVFVVERPALPLVSLAWASQAARDGGAPHEKGLAMLTARTLTEGTRLSDGRLLAHVRVNGETPQITVVEDGTVVSLHVPSSGTSLGVDTLAAIVRRPAVTPEGVQSARVDQLEGMLRESVRIDHQLRDAALFGLFGAEHPAVSQSGGHADVLAFTPDQVARFHSAHYAPDTSALVAVGAVTLEQVIALAERHFGDWPRTGGAMPAPPPMRLLERSKPIQALAGGGRQAWFALALPCPAASDPRGADFDLLGMILADLPLSRATRLLRHEEGIAYAVGAECDQTDRRGTFWMQFGVEPEHAGQALGLVLDQIRRLRSEEVPPDELEVAKIQMLGRFGGQLSTNAGIARVLAGEFLSGQPPGDVARWMDRVRNATSAGLRDSAKLYFNGHVGIATYGPRSLMQLGLARFGDVDWSTLGPRVER